MSCRGLVKKKLQVRSTDQIRVNAWTDRGLKIDIFFPEWDYSFHSGPKEFILSVVIAVAGL